MRGDQEHLQQLVADLGGDARLLAVGNKVAGQLEQLADEMSQLIVDEIAVFRETADSDARRAGWLHGLAHARKISELLRRQPTGDLQFVVEHARMRAEQHFPLNDILHTYRIGHRVMWRCMRDAAMELAETQEEGLRTVMSIADFTIRYTNLISIVLTRAYTQRERQLSDSRGRQTRLLFEELEQGRLLSADGRLLAESIGLGKRPYIVAVFASTDPAEAIAEDKAAEIADALLRKLGRDASVLIDSGSSELRALIVLQSTGAEARLRVIERLAALAGEFGVRCGVGLGAASEKEYAAALSEAAAALDYTTESMPLADLGSISLHRVLFDHRHLDITRLLPAWFFELADGDSGGGSLRETITAFADSNLSVKGAAKALGIHPNTVRFRLNKIERLTSISPKSFRGLQELLVVMSLTQTDTNDERRPRRLA